MTFVSNIQLRTRRLVTSVLPACGVMAALCVPFAVSLFCAAGASAAISHSFVSSFGSNTNSLFKDVEGIAVDESTGDVYVYDSGFEGGTIFKFDATGKPVNFSATGTNTITNLGSIGTGGLAELAVDNAPFSSAKGDIYVTGFTSARSTVGIYSSSGAKVGELNKEVEKEVPAAKETWTRGNSEESPSCGVATDASGNVYVATLEGRAINKYKAPSLTNHVENTDYESTLWRVPYLTCNIAVDSTGTVFAASWHAAVQAYAPGQFNTSKVNAEGHVVSPSASSVAVEPSTDNLYVNTVQNIEEYGPHGEPFEKPIARFAAESEGEGTIKGESYGIAVDGTSGDIYFPDGAGHISVFGPGVFVPEVTLDPPSNIEKTKATVSGTVNPDGVPVTSCAFEYGPKYARSVPCPASPGSGSSPVAETVELTGLEPSQEYEVRLSAGNAQGKNYRYQKFTTLGPPTVSVPELVARATTKTAATLHGQIVSSNGFDTTYYFEYGPTTAYGTSVPVPSVDIGTVKGIPVEATVTGLTPGTEYHARLVATNSAGTTYSEDRAFRTVPVAAIQSEHVVNIGLEEATLQALIGPLGDDTLYHFEYGPTSAYGSTVPLYDADVGVGSLKENLLQRELVAQRIGGLRPGTVYHYRAVATNALGTAYGEDRTFTTLPSATAAPADTCPNAALRTGLSADLPDCRAYEMVSPLDKNGGSVGGAGFNDVQASVDGEGVAYTANTGFADAVGSGYVGSVVYVGSRGPSGWVTHAVTPTPPKASFQAIQEATRTLYFSSDLSSSLLFGFRLPGADLGTGLQDLYRENTADRGLETVTLTDNPEPNACNCVREFYSQETVGYSSDMGVIVFETAANLLPETSGPHLKLYEWDHGVLRVAGRLPDGSIAGGAKGPFDKAPFGENTETLPLESVRGAVSSDGKKVLFYSPVDNSPQRQLYMRKDGSSTVWLSRSWTSTPNPEPQGVTYEAASADGSKVLFASSTPLLNSDPGGATMGLYLYTDSASNPESEGKLKFITRVNDVNDEYSFSGIVNNDFVAWMSEDATHIYLYSERAPGYPKQGEYLWDSGKVHFITGLGKPIGGLLAGLSYNSVLTPIEPVSVSSDGRRLVFVRAPESAEQELLKPATGGDVVLSSIPGHPTVAVYVYDEGSETVSCVSCPSDGEPQTTNAAVQEVLPDGVLTSGTLGDDLPVNFTSRDGRFVFFTSQQPLVPQDTNGLPDVYEYDADARAVKLVSSGTGENGSWFQAASANGSDVFFLTKEKLTGWDTDTAMDLYDARINGGLAEPPVLAPPCDGDACQGVPSAVPSFSTASGFSGLGNQQPNAVAVEKSAKVKRKPAKKHRKKAHRGKARGARRRGSGVSVSNRAGR